MVSSSAPAKIVKPPGEKIDEVETQVSQVSFRLNITLARVTRPCVRATFPSPFLLYVVPTS